MKLNRAYSLLEIKEVDDDARTITGIASTPTPDRMGDIVKPEGAVYTLPVPLLWQHNSAQPIGQVTKAKVTKKGIEIVAEIAKGVSEEIDRAWALIKAGLVRGLSIGFRGLDTEQVPNSWGIIFEKWEWLELSAVTIPANSEATIQTVKSIDAELLALSGKDGSKDGRGTAEPGSSGRTDHHRVVSIKPEDTDTKMNIAEQIGSFEASRKGKADRLAAIMEASAEKGETLNAEEAEEYDTLEGEVAALDVHIKRLKTLEATKAAAAKPVTQVENEKAGSDARDIRLPAQVKAVEKLPPGIAFARLAKVKALSRLDGESPRTVAKELYGENSSILALLTKAPVPAATTGGQTWGSQLVGEETSAFADFVEFLRPQTILGRFGMNGIPSLRRVPFRVPLVGQTSGGAGYWVGEAKAKPLTSFAFNRTTLEPLKVANIAVASEEVLRDSSPSAEMIIRDSLAAALRERLDEDFIDPAKTADAGISPASITQGVAAIPSNGADADGVRADIQALFAAFIAANNPPTSGVFIMPATMALALSLMTNPLGQAEFPGISMSGGTFFGLPVIVSEYVPTITGGSYVVLVNASDIYLADEGGINVDMSREASLEMDTAPTMNADSPTEQTVVSLWQTNSVGFRAERTINWARRRSSAVAVLSGVNWSPGSE